MGMIDMPNTKKLTCVLAMIAASVMSTSVLALDGATLFTERTCIACHGAEGRLPIMTEYPKVAGLAQEYSLAQMKDIKSGARSNSHALAMKNVMHLISDEEMAAVTAWLAGLPR